MLPKLNFVKREKLFHSTIQFFCNGCIFFLKVNFELKDTKKQDNMAMELMEEDTSADGQNKKANEDNRKADERKQTDKKKKDGSEKKKKLEPSLKWKKLEVEKDDEE